MIWVMSPPRPRATTPTMIPEAAVARATDYHVAATGGQGGEQVQHTLFESLTQRFLVDISLDRMLEDHDHGDDPYGLESGGFRGMPGDDQLVEQE